MNSSLLDKIGIDPAIILIILLVLVIVLFGLVFYLMANIKKRNKDIKRLLSGKTAGDATKPAILRAPAPKGPAARPNG